MSIVKKKVPMHRVMITIPTDLYNYCRTHFIRISPLCIEALNKYISELESALNNLKTEIPPLVDIKQRNDIPPYDQANNSRSA